MITPTRNFFEFSCYVSLFSQLVAGPIVRFRLYFYGVGVPKDSTQALKWYRQAAGSGDAVAQYNLGFMHHDGEGVPKDTEQTVQWYRKAAQQGFAEAQY